MIPFPFSLFYIVADISGLQPFTGFYDSYESYSNGVINILTSGIVLESGKKIYTTGKYGFFTGYTYEPFDFNFDNYEHYNLGNIIEFNHYSGYINRGLFSLTGFSYDPSDVFFDSFEKYQSPSNIIEFTGGMYTGNRLLNNVATGHSDGGYIPVNLQTSILSIPNLTSIGPAYFTGSGLILTGDWDRIRNQKIGYLNKASGLYFFDHLLRWDRPAGTINNFTFEIALRRSGWAVDSSRMVDNSSPSGFALQRNSNTNNMRAGVSGNFDNSTFALPDNVWTFISVVRSGSTMSFYANGIFSNSFTTTAVGITNTFPIYLGKRATAPVFDLRYQGYMDEFRYWNYARTSGEIYSGSTGTVDPNSAGLQCYLSL